MSYFGLWPSETEFLQRNLKPTDRVFEWGSGGTTDLFRENCKRVTSVEHQPSEAWKYLYAHATGISKPHGLIIMPPDLPYVEGGDDDGDLETFRSYVECYQGRGIDVVLVDGRARCACVQYLLERAPFGPDPDLKIFVHDVERPQYAPIFEMLQEVERVERLALLKVPS